MNCSLRHYAEHEQVPCAATKDAGNRRGRPRYPLVRVARCARTRRARS
jgi:hypothetical protein